MKSALQSTVVGCAVIIFSFFFVPDVQALSAKEVYAKTADQVVTIECWNSNYIRTKQGSGIVLGRVSDKHGVDILTNYHVINSSNLIRITTKKGEAYKANILRFDAPTDTALIRVGSVKESSSLGGLVMNIVSGLTRDGSLHQLGGPRLATDISVGDTVYAVGAPKGLGWTITSGIISAIRGDQEPKLVQTNASISAGSSGGGLFNDSGELIGMTSFDVKDAQNLNFAIAISETFLSSLKAFREKDAGLTDSMPEDFWFIGHYEPGDHVPVGLSDVEDLDKLSNPALKRWWAYNKKWTALSREQLKAFSSDAGSDEWETFDVKIASLLAQRYADFPNDRVGFLAHLDFVKDRQTKINELLAAAEKWPGEVDIVWALYSTLSEDETLPMTVILAPLRAFVDALPSKSEVKKLAGYEFAPGVYRVALAVERLEPILKIVDHTLRGIKEREQTARIRSTLAEKGWNVKRE
jgi:hypothetical protein